MTCGIIVSVRIIAGKWRGSRLLPPDGPQTRPILDAAKEAVFNILGARLERPGVLPAGPVMDLFAGTGSIGLEALSRGAAHCTFVEGHRPTARILQSNIARLHAEAAAAVEVVDVHQYDFRLLRPRGPYMLAFVDPPYRQAARFEPAAPINQLIARLLASAVLASGAIVVLRHPHTTPCPVDAFPGLRRMDQRRFGTMMVSFFENSAQPAEAETEIGDCHASL